MGATTRLFLALWPDAAGRAALAAWRDAWAWPRGATPVDDAKLHLTLHFLGNQPSERVPELIDGFAVPITPFSIELGRPVLWPHGLAVLEPFSEPAGLLQLHADLAAAVERLGLVPEARRYRPHVTMSRRAPGAVPPSHPPLVWHVSNYALVQSSPVRGYEVLRTYS